MDAYVDKEDYFDKYFQMDTILIIFFYKYIILQIEIWEVIMNPIIHPSFTSTQVRDQTWANVQCGFHHLIQKFHGTMGPIFITRLKISPPSVYFSSTHILILLYNYLLCKKKTIVYIDGSFRYNIWIARKLLREIVVNGMKHGWLWYQGRRIV